MSEPSFLSVFQLQEKMYTLKHLLCNGKTTHVYNGTHSWVDLPLLDSGFLICSLDQNGMMHWHLFLNTLLQLCVFIIAICDVN